MDTRPTIAISMGDPLGIGPEVTLKALADASLRGVARFVVHGHNATLTRIAERCGIVPTWFRVRAGSDRAQESQLPNPDQKTYPLFLFANEEQRQHQQC